MKNLGRWGGVGWDRRDGDQQRGVKKCKGRREGIQKRGLGRKGISEEWKG